MRVLSLLARGATPLWTNRNHRRNCHYTAAAGSNGGRRSGADGHCTCTATAYSQLNCSVSQCGYAWVEPVPLQSASRVYTVQS
ncbi:hypothetical protein GUJ93_ZPchr0001g29436 [Zizania palustris]|uniref:Uncharacterized protein n=1 Tax=Zizania palustris TaxID=103762 RepID=A0A8J5S2M5_ZIZPA|nr:hypothetical protein GUJ93_ZPchr0001g29436 [Zizania palustris]